MIPRVLFDINVVLDVLLERAPHVKHSAQAWAAAEHRHVEGLLAAHAFTTIHYLTRTQAGPASPNHLVAALLQVFGVAAVDQSVLKSALAIRTPDFEDAVTAAAALHSGCDLIVSRDPAGYRNSPVRTVTPEAFLASIKTR